LKSLSHLQYRFLFALVITMGIGLVFIRAGHKYRLDIVEKILQSEKVNHYFVDLNGDGNTERIFKYFTSINKTSTIIYNPGGGIIEQFNFVGRFPSRSNVYFGDYDADSLKEIYLFTYVGDSLFLNIYEPLNKTEPIICRRFIDIAPLEGNEARYIIGGLQLDQHSGLNNKRIYFNISGALALNPRYVYSYDINNDVLNKSNFAGNSPRYTLHKYDIDNDGKNEYYGPVVASGNYHDSIPFSDQSVWLMIYNSELDYVFPPVEFKAYPAVVTIHPFFNGRENVWSVIYQYMGTRNDLRNSLMLYSIHGDLLKSVDLDSLGLSSIYYSFVHEDFIYVVGSDDGILIKFNEKLEVVKRIQSAFFKGNLYGPYAIANVSEEVLLVKGANSMNIVDLKGRKLMKESFESQSGDAHRLEKIINYKGYSGYHYADIYNSYKFNLIKRNRWFWFSLKLATVFVLVFFTIYLIQYIQIRQEQERLEIKMKLREYQLISIKKQIDPHFIFNALNAIASMNLKGDSEKADEYLIRFSGLMREVLDTSEANIVSLAAELNFIRKYLSLEQLRLGREFEFIIDVPGDCQDIQIPSMAVFTFVENAVKHGLADKKGEKVLRIHAERENDLVKIEVEDNGPGLDPANRSKYSTGKGFAILRKMFLAYHQLTDKKIRYVISEGKTGGVLITMSIEV